MSIKRAPKDETLKHLDRNAREKGLYESRQQDYTVFPIYEQYNPLIYEDILYSRNQEVGTAGSHLLGIDVESGITMSQEHKIPTKGYLNDKSQHSVRYQARFPWESDYSGYDPQDQGVKVDMNGGELLNKQQQAIHQRKNPLQDADLVHHIDKNTRHIYGNVSPFDLQSIGELGNERDICDNALFMQTAALERVAMENPDKLANYWNNKGIVQEGITRPIVLNSADRPYSKNTLNNNIFTNNSNDDLFTYRSRTPSPSILPRSLRPRTPSPPKPPPKYYNPDRYSENVNNDIDNKNLGSMGDVVIGQDGREYTLPTAQELSSPELKLKSARYGDSLIAQQTKQQTSPTKPSSVQYYHEQVTKLGALLHDKTGFHQKYSYDSTKQIPCSKVNCASKDCPAQHVHTHPNQSIPSLDEIEEEEQKETLENLKLGNGSFLVDNTFYCLNRKYVDEDQARLQRAHQGGFGTGVGEKQQIIEIYDYRDMDEEIVQFQTNVDTILSNQQDSQELKQKKLKHWLYMYEKNLVKRRLDSEIAQLENMMKIVQRKELSAMNYQAWCEKKDLEKQYMQKETRQQRREAEIQKKLQLELLHLTKKGISFESWMQEKNDLLRHLKKSQENMLRETILRQQQEKADRNSGIEVAVQKLLKRSWERQKQAWQSEEQKNKQIQDKKLLREKKNEHAFQEWLYGYHSKQHNDARERVRMLRKAVEVEKDKQEQRKVQSTFEYDKWLMKKQTEGINATEYVEEGLTPAQKVDITQKGPHAFGYSSRKRIQDTHPHLIPTRQHLETRDTRYISGTPFYDIHKNVKKL